MEELLHQYFCLLKKWNRKINLTAIADEPGFRAKHVDDALSLIPYIESAKRVVDLGSGAGIPGLILKIARPDLEVVLIDSTRKKIAFCEEVIRNLNLSGVTALWARAENVAVARSVEKFDIAVSRATWKLAQFLEVAAPFIREGGSAIAMKGPKWADELKVLGKASIGNLSLEGAHPYKLRNGEKRCLVVFKNPATFPASRR